MGTGASITTLPIRARSGTASRGADLHFISRRSDRTLILLLIGCSVLPYANTLLNEFVYDDFYQVLRNPYVHSFRYLREIFTTPAASFIYASPSNYYRPVMTFGYLLCYKLFGLAPSGFHLANVVLNGAVVCALFLVTVRMFRDRTVAFVAAAAFALHPIHTEPVAWIAAVTDVELTLFYLLTFWFFFGMPSSGRSERMQLAMVASFALALLSKEQALTLPFLATVYEHFYRGDRSETTWEEKFARYRVLWLLAIAYILLRVHFLRGFAPQSKFPDLTTYQAFLSALALVGQYLWKLLWPAHLCAFYVFHKSVSLLDPRVFLGGLGGLVVCAALFACLWERGRTASFGLIWLFATLAPVLNPHWVGLNVFTERYLYLPSVGFCWVVAWILRYLWARASGLRPASHHALVAALGILVLLCGLRIVTANRHWQNSFALYASTLAVSPEADDFRVGLGGVYRAEGDLPAAEQELRQVLRHDPNHVDALIELGKTAMEEGRYEEATGLYLQAIELQPMNATSHLNLGIAYSQTGSMQEAKLQLRAATVLAPRDPLGYLNLGVACWLEGDRRGAESTFRRALSINPFDSGTHLALGRLYGEEGRTSEAAREYRAALEADPGNVEASVGLKRLESPGVGVTPSKP